MALSNNKGSTENMDLDTSLDDQSLTDQEKERDNLESQRPGRKYIAEKYPGLVIIDGELFTPTPLLILYLHRVGYLRLLFSCL